MLDQPAARAEPLAGEPQPRLSGMWQLVGALALSGSVYGLASTMAAPAIPQMQQALHASAAGIGWVVSCYLIAASAGVGVIGRLGDDFGRRRMLLVALVVFTAGCVLCTVAASLPLMVVGRVLQGTGGGGVYPLAFGILRQRVAPERRDQAVGLTAATLGIGGGLGPLLGGLLTEAAGFRWVFVVPAILGAAAIAWVMLTVPRGSDLRRHSARVDLLGAILLPAGVVAPLLAVSQANHWGWGAGRTLALLGAGAVLLALFALVETRVRQPLINLRTLAHPVVLTTNVAAVGYSVYAFGTLIGLTLLAQQHGGIGYALGPAAAGLVLLPHGLGNLLGALVASHFPRRSRIQPLVLGQLVALTGYALFLPFLDVHALAILMSGMTGFGVGISLAATTNNVISAVPPAETATAASITTTVRNIGGAAGAQVVIALFGTSLLAGTHDFSRDGFRAGFALLTTAAFVALVLALRVPAQD